MIRLAALALALALTPALAADLAAFDYRDRHGVRHWNHYAGHVRHIRPVRYHARRPVRRHVRPHSHVVVIPDRVRFVPIDNPTTGAPQPVQVAPPVVPTPVPPATKSEPPPSWAGKLAPMRKQP